MPRLNADQLAGFRRQSQRPASHSPTTPETSAPPVPEETTPPPEPELAPPPASGHSHSDAAPFPQPVGPLTTRTSAARSKGSKAVLHLPKPTAGRLRAISEATGYPLSRLVTAAVTESTEPLRKELDGGVPLLRRRPNPGREAFTLWLPSSTRAILKDLAQVGGISASEVATRALESLLDRLEADQARATPPP
jgi:hypothetical protein